MVVGHVGDLGRGRDHAEEREKKDVYCFFHIAKLIYQELENYRIIFFEH